MGQGSHRRAECPVTAQRGHDLRSAMSGKGNAREGILRAQIFDGSWVRQGGQLCQTVFDVESTPSDRPRRRWLPGLASAVSGFLWVDSLDSVRNPPFPERWLRKPLKMSRNLSRAGAGGSRVDSPVKRPDARKVPGCAPPYTYWAGEEPWRRDWRLPFR
jgi:hypothetical protein